MRDLSRFLLAQKDTYGRALAEIKSGRKSSHWMWFIFPQLSGLGHSSTAQYYALRGAEEARAYLSHPILSQRLIEISEALLMLPSDDAEDILGYPDNLKLKSSMTLFWLVSDRDVFKNVLNKFFDGEMCAFTVSALNAKK